MARYHINDKDEVHTCSAKIKCRFGGSSGKENHFSSKAAAEAKQQEIYSKKYGALGGVSRGKAGEELRKLSQAGMRVTQVSSVTKHSFPSEKTLEESSVDVLDEKAPQELLASIRRGDTVFSL